MRLEQLHYIVEVSAQKSISKAAKNLFISQPSLSKSISQLENELGVPLFVRLQQGIIPTVAGEAIIEKAKNILSELDEIKAITAHTQSVDGAHTLRIALPLLLCNDLLNHTLQILRQRCPTLTILPYQADNYDVINDLNDGSLDLGIISYSASDKETLENELKKREIFSQTLSREDFYLVASANSPWAQYACIPYKALSHAQIATFSDILKYSSLSAPNDIVYLTNATVYLPSKESLLKLLLDDDHVITIFPRIGALTDSAVRSGELVALPISDFPNTQYISLLLNATKALHPQAHTFLEVFIRFYNEALKL